jgi:hypothetical protein
MVDREELADRLLQLLAEMDFSQRYYRFYEDCARHAEGSGTQDVFVEAVRGVPFEFRYVKKDKFFEHVEASPVGEFVFKAAFVYSAVEFLFHVRTPQGTVGGPFPRLAREAAQARDPAFSYGPASPKLPFDDAAQARAIVEWGIARFAEIKAAVLTDEGWRD